MRRNCRRCGSALNASMLVANAGMDPAEERPSEIRLGIGGIPNRRPAMWLVLRHDDGPQGVVNPSCPTAIYLNRNKEEER
jgi:hypothetical protein